MLGISKKMLVYIPLESNDGVSNADLKCDPEKSAELREKYHEITETDFNTLLWNLVTLDSDVPDKLIKKLIKHSVEKVIKKLPKKNKKSINFYKS